jgi:hypothetical protein
VSKLLKNRILYLCFLVFTIILGIYKDGYLSTMLFFGALVFPLISLSFAFFTLTSFRLLENVDQRIVVKGDVITYSYKISNHTKLLFCPMTITFTDSKVLFKDTILGEEDEFILYPDEVKETAKRVDCRYRGCYHIGIQVISIRDFFNLFKLNFKSIENPKILVYPKIRELEEGNKNTSLIETTESIVSKTNKDPSIFSNVRDYRAADSLKTIHWKLSAKQSKLLTKQYEGSVNCHTKIIINSDGLPFNFEQNVVIQDYIIESVVATIKYLLQNNTPLRLAYYKHDNQSISGNNNNDFGQFYNALANMMFSGKEFISILKKELNGSRQYINTMIFTPYVTKELSEYIILNRLKLTDISVYIINEAKCEVGNSLAVQDKQPLLKLISNNIKIYKISYENELCRLEVA